MRPGQRSFVWASGFPEARAAYPETATGRRWHTKYTAFPYLALLRVGFAKPIRYRTAGALLPHLFTLTGASGIILRTKNYPRSPGGIFSVALSVPYEPSNYEAHCPAEFGLSSAFAAIARLPANPMILCTGAISAIPQVTPNGIPSVFRLSDDRSAALPRAGNIDGVRRIFL